MKIQQLGRMFLGLCMASLMAPAAHAAELISFGGGAYHFERDLGYNEFNYGLGYERDIQEDWSVSGGVYKNSIRRAAFYVLANYYPFNLGAGFRVGVAAGPVTGYRHVAVVPAVMPTLEWRGERLALQSYVIPTIKPNIDGAFVVQVKYLFDK